MKSVDVKPMTYFDFNKENNKEDRKFEVGGHIRTSKFKNFFAKGCTPNWSEEVFAIKKFKNTVLWTYVISDLKTEKTVATFYGKELQKRNQKEFKVEKVIKRKVINCMSSGKATIIILTVGLIKKMLLYKMSHFLEPLTHSKNKIEVELNLSNYAIKSDLKMQQVLIHQILLKILI